MSIKELVWTTGWTNVILPVAPIPVSVSYKLGVRVDGEVRAHDPIRLIVEGRGRVAGTLGVTQAGSEVRLDPPESLDVKLEPRVEASGDFSMDLHPAPWIDVRLYGLAGGRLTVPTDVTLTCTAVGDPSARRCRVDYRVAPTVQPLIGSTTVNVMLWEGPVIPVPLPAALRSGTVDVPVAGLDARRP